MRLFEAILEANRRAAAGDTKAAETVSISTADLPVAVLSCVDARLNTVLPDALGIPESQLVWLRNAGNIITGPFSSTMRSLALACAVKGAKEIAVIGHTDCLVGKTSVQQLLDRLAALGVDRHRLPENLVEYFGLFGTERQNVLRAVDCIRASPLIGAKIPVHGLLVDVRSGRLAWLVNGYQPVAAAPLPGGAGALCRQAERTLDAFAQIGNIAAEEMKLPAVKIGEWAGTAKDWLHQAENVAAAVESALPPKVPSRLKATERQTHR
jgi:carbonic anhydrase